MLKNRKSEITIPETNPGVTTSVVDPGWISSSAMTTHGTEPAKQPNTNGSHPPSPGTSYFSCSQPNRIIDAFTAKIAMSVNRSVTEQICAISQIITEDDSAYSTQRA